MTNIFKRRILFTKLIALPLVAIQMFTNYTWSSEGFFDLIEVLGVLLIGVAVLGRGWSSLFISGRKTHDLVTVGPYSIVRNPLYVFSFIGAVGIGLCSTNFVLLLSLISLFIFYYPGIIEREEIKLALLHGDKFKDYCAKVPRLIPSFSLYSCPQSYEIDTRRVASSLRDSLGFLCAFPLIEAIESIQKAGYLPTVEATHFIKVAQNFFSSFI